MTGTEESYLKSIGLLSGASCSGENAANFLRSKSILLLATISPSPEGAGKTIINHYAKKLSRVAELILNNQLTERGDADFALDQLNSAKRELIEDGKDVIGLENFVSTLETAIKNMPYLAKGEN